MTIFGSGYVGLVAAAGFADAGHQVPCIDIDEKRIERLCAGDVPFFEPGLPEVVTRSPQAGRLTFGTTVDAAHRTSEVCSIAVGTPPSPTDARTRAWCTRSRAPSARSPSARRSSAKP